MSKLAERIQERLKAIASAVVSIERQFGKGALMKLGDQKIQDVESVSTGSIGLDRALGVGGLPRGRVVEIYGPESSGKTTLALHAIAEVQRSGGIAAFIDAEHALDIHYARKLGVDVDGLFVSQPDTGEQALEIVETLVRSGGVDLIVIDSVAALTPKAEIEGEMGDQHMGLQARLMSQALRKLTAVTGKQRTIVIFINQIRMKIGVVYGNPETTTGGHALKFYSSVRLEIRRGTPIKIGDQVVGHRTKVKVVKNKLAPPFREVEFDVRFGEGIDKLGDLLDTGIAAGVIERSGSHYSCGKERLGAGRETAIESLRGNTNLAEALRASVLDKMTKELGAQRKGGADVAKEAA